MSAPGFLPDMELSLEELGRMTAGAVTQQKLAAEGHDLCREIFTCGADKMCISQVRTGRSNARPARAETNALDGQRTCSCDRGGALVSPGAPFLSCFPRSFSTRSS